VLKISYAGCFGLSPAISSARRNSVLKWALNLKLAKKLLKTPFWEGSKSFKAIDVDQSKKPVASACYDKQHMCT